MVAGREVSAEGTNGKNSPKREGWSANRRRRYRQTTERACLMMIHGR